MLAAEFIQGQEKPKSDCTNSHRTQWSNSADNKLMVCFLFLPKNRI